MAAALIMRMSVLLIDIEAVALTSQVPATAATVIGAVVLISQVLTTAATAIALVAIRFERVRATLAPLRASYQ